MVTAQKRAQRRAAAVQPKGKVFWGVTVGIIFAVLLVCGWFYQELRRSIVAGNTHRVNLVLAGKDGRVEFVSYDPQSSQEFVLPFPEKISIRSRSVGEYSIGSLYKLGTYEGSGGEFVRRKVQGFMRVPISGYIVEDGESNLTTLDKWDLWLRGLSYTRRTATEDELVRAGVLEAAAKGYVYHPERLQQYVGSKLFDWGIGSQDITVAVVNQSGVDGLGSDIADFLTNIGLDVVMVRSADVVQDQSRLGVTTKDLRTEEAARQIETMFRFPGKPENPNDQYRAGIVVYVGKDALGLF